MLAETANGRASDASYPNRSPPFSLLFPQSPPLSQLPSLDDVLDGRKERRDDLLLNCDSSLSLWHWVMRSFLSFFSPFFPREYSAKMRSGGKDRKGATKRGHCDLLCCTAGRALRAIHSSAKVHEEDTSA